MCDHGKEPPNTSITVINDKMSKVDHTTSATETPLQEVIRRDSNLRLISSPVATGLEDHEKGSRLSSMGLNGNGKSDIEHLKFHNTDERNCPEFIKHTNSTNYELFYDLWFVANLEVFSSSKGINKESDLYAYVGYLRFVAAYGVYNLRSILTLYEASSGSLGSM